MTCPTCRQQSILPQKGVTALQANIFINNLLDVMSDPNKQCSNCDQQQEASSKCTHCEAFLCEQCIQPHIMENESVAHHVISMNEVAWADGTDNKSMALKCSNHQGQHLSYYCAGCETAICQSCTELEHHTHETVPLSEAIQEHRNILNSLLQKAQREIPVITDAFSVIQTVSDTLALKYESIESQIHEAFDTIQKLLDQRKAVVLEELKIVYNAKSNTLKEQEKELEETLKQVNKCCEFTQDALDHGNETEILLVSKEMSEKLESFGLPPSQNGPEENDFLEFCSSDFNTAKKLIQQLGSIQSNSAVAFETVATGEGLKKCYIGKQALVNITTKDKNGDLIRVGHASFSAQLTSSNRNVIIPDILDNKNGTYDLSYELSEPGTYSLDVRLFDQPIRGSPFKVKARPESESMDQVNGLSKIPKTSAVKQKGTKRTASSRSYGSNRKSNPVEDDLLVRVGSKGRTKGEFTNPQGICCTAGGKILVADSNNQCVQAFTNTGELKLKFGVRGRSAGQLQRPTGVAETVNGNFLVADYDNRWVSVFSPEGKYINKLGTGKLLGPKGVVVDNNGHIIVVDNKASCVFIFQSNGKLIHKFGSRGNNEYQFAGPHFCAVNSRNDIIVSDFHNHCVKVCVTKQSIRASL